MEYSNIKKLGIISDVHNDYNALMKALNVLSVCDKIIFLGDLIDDDSEGNKIVKELIDRNIEGIIGNHDELAIKSNININKQTSDYIKMQPSSRTINGIYTIHDNPLSKEKNEGLWFYGGYINNTDLAKRVFDECNKKIMIVGHTHKAIQYCFNKNEVTEIKESKIAIDSNCRYILNPGAVYSQGSNMPSVGVYDFKKKSFNIILI